MIGFHWQGNVALEKSARKKPFDWLTEGGWADLTRLQEAFSNVSVSTAGLIGSIIFCLEL